MRILLSQAYAFSQQGKRDYQEDARWPDIDLPSLSQRFFIVCDGVGGSDHGEVASTTVCRAFARKMPALTADSRFDNSDFSRVLDYAYDQLDKVGRSTEGDMATTLTFVCFHAQGCLMAHIGDSRIYQIRTDQGIIYRSDDHSLVNNMVHHGLITPEQAENHPQRNVITRCMEPVGTNQNRSQATVVRTTDVRPGDYFLLCSDGVLEHLTDDALTEIMANPKDTDERKMERVRAVSRDSSDNNTAILIRVQAVEQDSDSDVPEQTSHSEDHAKTVRFSRERSTSSEIESFQRQEKTGILGKLKRIFSADS